MNLKSISVALAMFSGMGGFCQTTIHLRPDADAALGYHDNFNTAGNNYGTASQNAAYCIPGAAGGENRNRALIHFDLSQISVGTQIQSATLDLYALGPSGTLNGHTGSANTSLLKQVLSPWQEMSVTWNSQPTYSSTAMVTLSPTTNPTLDYLGINVTALVQDMINNPSSNYGFGLMLQNEVVTNGLLFASREHTDSLLHPRLHITYCEQQLVTNPSDDAAIGTHDGLGTANNNYATAPQFAAYCITAANGTPNGNSNRALMHFDLTSIPTSAYVTSASLDLYARGPSGTLNGHTGNANDSYIAKVTSPWNASTVTWNNQPTTTLVDAAVLPQSTNSLQDYLGIDVTAMVRQMVANPSANHGFMLKLVNEVENNGLLFQSLDCGNSQQFPVLTVNYTCGKATGLEAESIESPIEVYPNPTAGLVRLRIPQPSFRTGMVDILDIAGNRMALIDLKFQSRINEAEWELNSDENRLPNGIYFVRITLDAKTYVTKLIVQN